MAQPRLLKFWMMSRQSVTNIQPEVLSQFLFHDMKVPDEKKQILADAQTQVDKITKMFRRGLMTEEERYLAVVKVWEEADDRF